tara:strand:- start:10679 stop:11545 length:867 start_codon:yes stop_codon:yes gene_type:complete
MKTVDTLVSDIYELVSTKDVSESVDIDECIDQFGERMKDLMRQQFKEQRDDSRKLRMSNIGRKDRFLWNVYNEVETTEDIQPHTYVKFLYGHVIEELLLFLARAAGHTVTDEQKKCKVNGITGSMDCKIDGIVTDVKSASSYGFKKFQDGTLAHDDPFGYVAQIKGYAASEGQSEFGWLAMDKANGHLTYLLYDENDKETPVYDIISYDVEEHIERLKEVVKQETPPDVCYESVPEGKSGNMKLSVGCSYCQYKKSCWPNVRGFLYSSGPRYLTEVKHEPKVKEIQVP